MANETIGYGKIHMIMAHRWVNVDTGKIGGLVQQGKPSDAGQWEIRRKGWAIQDATKTPIRYYVPAPGYENDRKYVEDYLWRLIYDKYHNLTKRSRNPMETKAKAKRKFSAAQLAAQKKFAERARAGSLKKKPARKVAAKKAPAKRVIRKNPAQKKTWQVDAFMPKKNQTLQRYKIGSFSSEANAKRHTTAVQKNLVSRGLSAFLVITKK